MSCQKCFHHDVFQWKLSTVCHGFLFLIHRKSVCLCEKRPQWLHKSALKVNMIHCDSSAALAPVCLLCMERDLVCNTPRMVASLVRGHSSDSHPCHFAHTRHNLRSSLRAMEWFECRMHITCFHLVATPLVCIHQEWLGV